jgi:hypothetical protein
VGDDLSAGGLAQAVPQVPAIGDLDRVGQGPADRFGVGPRTVPADHLDTRMFAPPGLQGVSVAVG